MPSRFALILLVATAALTLGQAWAAQGGATRILRLLLTWFVGAVVLARLSGLLLGWKTTSTIATMAGCIAAVALIAGEVRLASSSLADKNFRDRLEDLAIVHVAVVLLGGGGCVLALVAMGFLEYMR